MQGVEAALRRKDPDAKIFFAPVSLRAGGYWLPQLAEAIAEATAFVLLVGEHGLGPWQIDEYYEARDRRLVVVLVLLQGQPAPGLPFLRQLHWVVTADPASEQSLARLMDAASGSGTRTGELWRYTAPSRGLSAMTESDADFFFGRNRETAEVIGALAAAPDRLPMLLGNSGVGKSSLAQAGVLAALMRQDWPEAAGAGASWPQAFHDSRRWCLLKLKPGTEPVRALVEPFLRTWQFDVTDPRRESRLNEWTENLTQGRSTSVRKTSIRATSCVACISFPNVATSLTGSTARTTGSRRISSRPSICAIEPSCTSDPASLRNAGDPFSPARDEEIRARSTRVSGPNDRVDLWFAATAEPGRSGGSRRHSRVAVDRVGVRLEAAVPGFQPISRRAMRLDFRGRW
jgi:hypothetical protein